MTILQLLGMLNHIASRDLRHKVRTEWVKAATFTCKSSGITSQERVDGKKGHSRRKKPKPCRAYQGTKFSLTSANTLTSGV